MPSNFIISSWTCWFLLKSVNVTKYEAGKKFSSSNPSRTSCLSPSLSLIDFIASSFEIYLTSLTTFFPSISILWIFAFKPSRIVSSTSSFITTLIPCLFSTCSITKLMFSPSTKKIPKINIVAIIIAIDALLIFLCLNTLLNASLSI